LSGGERCRRQLSVESRPHRARLSCNKFNIP
jgi:hypothetical protein